MSPQRPSHTNQDGSVFLHRVIELDLCQLGVWLAEELTGNMGKCMRPALNACLVEQRGIEFNPSLNLTILFRAQVKCDVGFGRRQPHFSKVARHARNDRRHCFLCLVNEHRLENRCVGKGSIDFEILYQAIKRQLLVYQCAFDQFFCLLDQIPDAVTRMDLHRQHHGVGEKANELIGHRCASASNR